MKCEKCGKTYWTRECFNCRDEEAREKLNKTLSRTNNNLKRKINSNSNTIKIIAMTLITIAIASIYFNIKANPLIGEWKVTQKMFMGIGKLKFTSERMEMMGIVSKVNYEIDGKEVIVTDETGTGMIFKIIDKNTIYSELMGFKTTYKKIN